MNKSERDIDLDALYQQRKAEIVAPNLDEVLAKSMEAAHDKTHVNVNIKQKNKRSSLVTTIKKYLTITLSASIASFTVLAIINHLANPVSTKSTGSNDDNKVTVASKSTLVPQKVKEHQKVPQPLAKEVNTRLLKPETIEASKQEISLSEEVALDMPSNHIEAIVLPTLQFTNEALFIVKKVVPQYPQSALKDKISGLVKLSYQIDNLGKVYNIKVISSKHRHLTRAASSALKQWQFEITQSTDISQSFNIEFEFKLLK